MIKLYGNPVSTCTRKVLTALAETELPYEVTVVDLSKGEHKQGPHLARQPFGQIPAIDDDGFELFESRAICRYLSAKAGDKLTPKGPKARALMDQWSSVEQSNYAPHAMKYIYHYVFRRPQEPDVLEAAGAALEKAYTALSVPLSKDPFLAGTDFTIADIGYMPYLDYLKGTPAQEKLEQFPHVLAWWRRLADRPSWLKATSASASP